MWEQGVNSMISGQFTLPCPLLILRTLWASTKCTHSSQVLRKDCPHTAHSLAYCSNSCTFGKWRIARFIYDRLFGTKQNMCYLRANFSVLYFLLKATPLLDRRPPDPVGRLLRGSTRGTQDKDRSDHTGQLWALISCYHNRSYLEEILRIQVTGGEDNIWDKRRGIIV